MKKPNEKNDVHIKCARRIFHSYPNEMEEINIQFLTSKKTLSDHEYQ